MRSKQKIKLLIVDDERDICELTRNIFLKRNLVAYAAKNGTTAAVMAKRINPDIALIDIHMGKESGIDILKKLLEVSPDCKCIMTTWDKERAQEAKKIGAVDFIIKPIELPTLEKAVNKIIKKIRK